MCGVGEGRGWRHLSQVSGGKAKTTEYLIPYQILGGGMPVQEKVCYYD